MRFKSPSPLRVGDAVALIAPASGQKSGGEIMISQAIDVLSSWGLKVIQTPVHEPQDYLASNDDLRVASLKQALTNPAIKAIFVTRGGYGTVRLLSGLENIVVPYPRLLLGFSDITTLHLHFQGTENLHCVHAPNIATANFLSDEFRDSREQFRRFLLMDGAVNFDFQPFFASETRPFPMTEGFTGGCLSLLVASLGTAHDIDTTNKVLMIEEVGETPYKVDRMLMHLKNAGKFDCATAIVLGDFVNCDSPSIPIQRVLKKLFSDITCPVFFTQQFGHGNINQPWNYH